MSNATPTPRDSTTAKAPQLRGWVEIFRTGTHKDSKGREFTASESDLDQIIQNHKLGAAPAVIGHPKQDGPAYAWVGDLMRKGASLFSKFADINPAFDDGVALGAYRNRSISLVRDPEHGLRLRHVGWLGAVPPAIDGLSPAPVQFSQAEGAEVFEFSAAEDALRSAVWALDGVGRLLRGLREHVISQDGLDVADRVLPIWNVDDVVRQAEQARAQLDAAEPLTTGTSSMFSTPPTGDPSMTTFTQEQLDAAKAQAAKDAADAAAAQFAAQGSELAELRQQRKQEKITGLIGGWKAKGLVLPADEAGLAEFMGAIEGQEVFTFSAAGTEAKKAPLDWFAEFMAGRKAVVNLTKLPQDDADQVDVNSVDSITTAAHQFRKEQEEAGKTVTFEFAVQHVTSKLPG
jgi:hypothetical protein